MSIKSTDRRRASANNSSIRTSQFAGDQQTMLVRDIISEGPIEGLVNGGMSIYLNNDSLMSQAETPFASAGSTESYVSGVAGQNTVQINAAGLSSLKNLDASFIMIRYLLTLTGTVTLVSSVDVAPANSSYKIFKHTYRFTVASGGTLNSSMSSNGVVGIGNTNGMPSTSVKDLAGMATFPDNWGFSMLNVTPTTFDFETSRQQMEGKTYSVRISQFYKIASVTSSALTLVSPLQYTFLKKDYTVPGTTRVQGSATSLGISKKYDSSSYQLSTGHLAQAPHKSFFGTGTASVELSGPNLGTNLEVAVPQYIQGSTTASGSQLSAMDKVTLTFQYPSGLYRVNKDQGNEYPEFVAYRFELSVQRTDNAAELDTYVKIPGEYTYTASEPFGQTYKGTSIATGEKIWLHKNQTKDAYIFTNTIDLEPYKPFKDFKIKITRLTKSGQDDTSESRYNKTDWKAHPNSQSVHVARISNATGLVTEKLNYPFTAHATVTFSSKNFSNMPTRGYECYGLKVKIPNVYLTREELKETQAKYTRDPDTGLDTGSIQFWDGGFREEKVYTDNPAWIFYDILTNNRYGLGDWMRTEYDGNGNKVFPDIDIYSLYKISKYCDELVPDGKGGYEPRFRSNFYFTKATDCYKVLKDMATTFNSILYWSDGKLMPVMDTKKEPIYNFTKGNVIEGKFDYQTTGSKTRANQIIVSWNNPDNAYKLEPLIVEDRDNIIKTGRILKEEATAFGATSYGQALRFGRWKLWTAINQTEIVSFSTAINAAFLAPGDVINIQDADDFNISHSGRINSATTTQLTLDRQISINIDANNTYEVSVLFSGQYAMLNQDSATISGVSYSRGDLVPGITSKEAAENTVDSSTGEYVDIQFGEGTYVQSRSVISASVVDGKTVLVCNAFHEAPASKSVWAVQHKNLGDIVATSYKAYKIMSIAEESKDTYSIVAVEHYDEKFDAIEGDFTLEVEDPLYPEESEYEEVPTAEDLRVTKRPRNNTSGEEVFLQWTAPSSLYATSNALIYEHIAGYELEYYDADERYTVFLSPDTTSYVLNLNTIEDQVVVGITTISGKGRRSEKVYRIFDLVNAYSGDATRINGIKAGGLSDTNFSLNTATGLVSFSKQPTLASAFGDQAAKVMTNFTSQATSGLADSSYGYLLADYSVLDTADALRLVQYISDDSTLRVNYWKEVGSSAWTSGSGTVTITANATKVVGTGTAFLTDFLESGQQIIYLSSTQAAYVTSVESDTVLYIDRAFSEDYSGSYSKAAIEIDYENDFLIGRVTRFSSTQYQKISYLTIDTDLEAAGIYSVKPIYANATNATSTDPIFSASFSSTGKSYVYFYRYLGEEPTSIVWGTDPDPSGAFVRIDNAWDFTKIVGNSVTVGTVGTDVDGNTTVDLVDENGTTTITVSKGAQGVTGYNSATVFLYQPGVTVTKPTGDLVYTYSTGAVTGAGLGSWSTSPSTPAAGEKLWEIQATAFSNTSTDTIPSSEFSAPVAVSVSGLSGRSTAIITLYNKNTSGTTAPDDPTGDFTYTFSTKALSANTGASLNGWSGVYPTLSNGEYLWAIQGTVVSLEGGDTDTISASEFSDAAVIGSNIKGDKGDTGLTGFLYYESGTASTDSSYITATNVEEGQIAIVEATDGTQAGYRYSGTAWVSQTIVNSDIIFANAIGAEQLEISANAADTANSIFFDGINNVIKIYSDNGSGTAVLRVKLGNLAQ